MRHANCRADASACSPCRTICEALMSSRNELRSRSLHAQSRAGLLQACSAGFQVWGGGCGSGVGRLREGWREGMRPIHTVHMTGKHTLCSRLSRSVIVSEFFATSATCVNATVLSDSYIVFCTQSTGPCSGSVPSALAVRTRISVWIPELLVRAQICSEAIQRRTMRH